jgi:hypothetical protein
MHYGCAMEYLPVRADLIRLLRWRRELKDIFARHDGAALYNWMKLKEEALKSEALLDRKTHSDAATALNSIFLIGLPANDNEDGLG